MPWQLPAPSALMGSSERRSLKPTCLLQARVTGMFPVMSEGALPEALGFAGLILKHPLGTLAG